MEKAQEEVEVTTLDIFCKKKGIEYIDFLKMDIEGNEYNALLWAENMISQNRIKSIQIEFGGCDIDSKVFMRDF